MTAKHYFKFTSLKIYDIDNGVIINSVVSAIAASIPSAPFSLKLDARRVQGFRESFKRPLLAPSRSLALRSQGLIRAALHHALRDVNFFTRFALALYCVCHYISLASGEKGTRKDKERERER
jgi:hypothetical protein